MTYAEYRVAVVSEIHREMEPHGWSQDDANHCAMSCFGEFEKGYEPARAARILLSEASRDCA